MRVYVHQFAGIATIHVLPLAAGLLIASARRDPRLAEALDARIRVERLPPPDVVASYEAPDVLAFSMYTWNEQYTLAVGRLARRRHPEALTVVGGPSVPRSADAARAFLEAHSWIDALVLGEGEVTFREALVARLEGRALDGVAGLALRSRLGDPDPRTPTRARLKDFSVTASPYLEGVFEPLLARLGERINSAVVETNRGCPFSCSFCDWGQATQSRVHELPMERVLGELEWIAARRIPFVYIIDANFGIRKRDVAIVEAIAALKRRTGYPAFCYFHLTKNAHVRNLQTVQILREAGIRCQMALSMQDFEPKVLKAIKRSNIKLERSLKLRDLCNAEGIPTFNELLLGLPEQTLASFKASVTKAMTPYRGDTFNLYLTRLLENAELSSAEQRARYGLETSRVTVVAHMSAHDEHVAEFEEVVVATAAMPPPAWREAFRYGMMLSALYNLGALRLVLYNLQFVLGADIQAVLERLAAALGEAEEGSPLWPLSAWLDRHVEAVRGGVGMVLELPDTPGHRWSAEEGLLVLALQRRDAVLDALRDLIEAELGAQAVEVDPDWWGELFAVQRLALPRPGEGEVREVELAFDWLAHLDAMDRGEPTMAPRRATRVVATPPWYCGAGHDPATFFRSHQAALRARDATVRLERAGEGAR